MVSKQTKIFIWLICGLFVAGVATLFYFTLSAEEPPPVPSGPVATCGTLPLDVVLVIDRSGSMIDEDSVSGTPPQTRLFYAQQAANGLVDQLDQNGGVGGRDRPQHHLGVVSFGGADETGVTVDVPLGNADATEVKAGIDGLDGEGGTPLKQAMAAAANQMNTNKRTVFDGKAVQHVTILLSDGRPDPDTNRPNATEISQYLAASDIIYSIAVGQGGTGATEIDLELMQQLAKPASKYHQVITGDQLPSLFDDIFTEIACDMADLSLKKSLSNTSPRQNDAVVFTLELTNNGPDTASNISVKDELPTGLTLIPVADKTYDGKTWTVPSLVSGSSVKLVFSATVTAAAAAVINNVAEVSVSSLFDADSTPGNGVTTEDDYASIQFTVAAAAVTTPTPTPTTPPVTVPSIPTTPVTPTPTEAPSSGLGGFGPIALELSGLALLSAAGLWRRRLASR